MKKILSLIFILSILSTALFSSGNQEESNISKAPPYKGVIVYMEGEVSLNGEPAEIGQEVPRGVLIATGIDSYCEVVFGGENIFRIQEETLAEINLDDGVGDIDLRMGGIAYVLNKLAVLKKTDEFEITTPTMVASVRGTAFYMRVISDEESYICICNGTINTADDGATQSQSTTADHHKAYTYTRGSNGKVAVNSAKMLYHSDEDMDQLAEKIDYEIPWSKNTGNNY